MQIRFNALVLTATNAVKQGLDANVGLKVYTTGSTPPDPTQSTVPDSTIATIITCTGASGTLYAQDVIYSVNKFSTNSKSFVIEVSANDPSTILGIKDI